jgi:hypothetical protein
MILPVAFPECRQIPAFRYRSAVVGAAYLPLVLASTLRIR